MKKHLITLACIATVAVVSMADTVSVPLTKAGFGKFWRIEAEAGCKTSFSGDTLELSTPEGLTLWLDRELSAPVEIEYDACVMTGQPGDRLSDLNAFWMASDPASPSDFRKNSKGRGKFLNCYGMSLYYLGFGGNGNTTTRFRRYNGDRRGIEDANYRPAIEKEYTDADHLLKEGQWYHIRITADGFRTQFFINGERIVDFRDPEPLKKGYFGFRTTKSRTRITNFSYTENPLLQADVPLHWIGDAPKGEAPVTFGIPFLRGEVTAPKKGQAVALRDSSGAEIVSDQWPLAYWDDGSVKWMGVAATVPAGAEGLHMTHNTKSSKKKTDKSASLDIVRDGSRFNIGTGKARFFFSNSGNALLDSVVYDGAPAVTDGRIVATVADAPSAEGRSSINFTDYKTIIKSAEIEREGVSSACVKVSGSLVSPAGRTLFPFDARMYLTAGSPEMRIVYSFVYDADQHSDFVRSLGLRFDIPMTAEAYNRHVAFATTDGGVWSEPVQPLVGRRVLTLDGDTTGLSAQQRQMLGHRIPPYEEINEKGKGYIDNWATWDAFRLSQISPDAFSVRKRATPANPWLGTFSGDRANGFLYFGDTDRGVELGMEDFWQSCPSSLEVTGATTPLATVTLWMWSPEAEAMDMRHYDVRAHDLIASYEDVQEGMSTPYGIARTTTFTLKPVAGYDGKASFAEHAADFSSRPLLLPTPEYLHSRRAFGIWSLPDRSTPARAEVEDRLDMYLDIYKSAQEDSKWYGFWHYGDFMHAYDPVRHEWLYDVGGYAWDNTELASPQWLWYSFLRNGDADTWRLAKAMTRHNGDVDVYHIGDYAGLGSRHNVSHWGCGAKESRISQASWNRILHYLTADERAGDLMREVVDSDTLLYTLDPMRLAEPRDKYPCTAPARLRIGPDWVGYAANWMAEWERTGNTKYRDKIITGMESIMRLPKKMFTGPLALGYDPATGVITSECDPELQTTNHLMTIMGGFEFMNELMMMTDVEGWEETWRDHADRYKEMARTIGRNKFRVSRLASYAAFRNRDKEKMADTWDQLFHQLEHQPAPPITDRIVTKPEVMNDRRETLPISTNDAALWSLDAIYMQEVIPLD